MQGPLILLFRVGSHSKLATSKNHSQLHVYSLPLSLSTQTPSELTMQMFGSVVCFAILRLRFGKEFIALRGRSTQRKQDVYTLYGGE